MLFLMGMLMEYLSEMNTLQIVDRSINIAKVMSVVAFVSSYLTVGFEVVQKAFGRIKRKQMMDESFLMTIATFGAFLLGELSEACAVMLFYQVGEWFQSYAVGKSRKSITELMDICPEYAYVRREEGIVRVEPEDVAVGEMLVIRPGEKVPLDGIVRKGCSSLDTKAITGESMPRDITPGEQIVSGCVNMSAVLEVEVTKPYENSTVAKILDLVENASANKAEAEQFISRFAKVYTPIVVYSAVALAFLPPLAILLGNLLGVFAVPIQPDFGEWIYRGLVFLVTSCPCALVISIPLSFFGGIGGASKEGILVKGSNYLEALAKVDTIVMDKTGTLTKGSFSLTELHPVDITEEAFLETLAYVEFLSNHPIARSVVAAYKGELAENRLQNMKELAGKGIQVDVDGVTCYGGNYRLMEELGFHNLQENAVGTIIHLAKGGMYLGYAVVADSLKPDVKEAMAGMKACGITKRIMLTGDKKETAEAVAKEIGVDQVYAELLPEDKVTRLEELSEKRGGNGKICFVGDGMNDAPVLVKADVGIAMGAMGSDAAIEAADIVIMTDEPSKIVRAVKISRKTLGIVKQNIVGAIGIKVLVLILVAFGMVGMWAAVFADVGVAFLAILNAMRALHTK